MSRMTVRATAREMQTTPPVEETFTGWAKLVNINILMEWKCIDKDYSKFKLVNLADFYSQFY